VNAVNTWIAVGFVGQMMFFGRFLVQWIAAERRGESIVPVSFWYLSIGGGLVLLAYAVHRGDPVFMAGQAFGSIVYVRNLMLIRRKRREQESHSLSG
jgi:lipid-A-disaccharide synthase-like uncharacterized protein